jgi:hypothetical protein
MAQLVTPFRDHYERCRKLDFGRQLRECVDYLQYPDVLVQEFLESYYLVERECDPEAQLKQEPDGERELVLEPFYESLEFCVRGASGRKHRLVCVSGALSPLPVEEHPALARKGLDYLGLGEGTPPDIILGVAEAPNEETSYLLLLRVLNCFAELAPPFQVARLGRQVLRNRVDPNARFNLQIAVSELDRSPELVTLESFTRDLADVFKQRSEKHPQFTGMLGSIDCLELDPNAEYFPEALDLRWSV